MKDFGKEITMMTTLSLKERLQEISLLLAEVERNAEAERAYSAAYGDGGPWTGASQKCADLKTEMRDLELQLRGQELKAALDESERINAEITRLTTERASALATVEKAREHPTIQRWLKSDAVANQSGVGYAWQIIKPWLISLKPKTGAIPQVGAMDLDDWPNELKFSDAERRVVYDFIVTEDALRKTDVALNAAGERHRQLLAANPELRAAT